MLLRTSSFRGVPEVNNYAFREALEYVFSDYREPYIKIGTLILVKRSLAMDNSVVYKYTSMALALSGQEEFFFGSDEAVMTEARMRSLMEGTAGGSHKERSEAESLKSLFEENLFEWKSE